MSLQGQALAAYTDYIEKTMKAEPVSEEPSKGLLSRNKVVKDEDKKQEPVDYVMEQFKAAQQARVMLKNGRT
tara:strand:+ start:246 stop:461 length:216 start_codon:yes stop_codon:yes gene_type:complete